MSPSLRGPLDDLSSFLRIFGVLLFSAFAARAHPILQDAMWVQFEPAGVRVAVDVSLREIAIAQDVELKPELDRSVWNHAAAQEGEYILHHLTLSAGTKRLTGTIVSSPQPFVRGEPERTFFPYEIFYPWRGTPPSQVTFFNDMLDEHLYAAGTAWNVSYVIRAKRAGAGNVTAWFLGYRQPAVIPTGWIDSVNMAPTEGQNWRTFCAYVWNGILHILTGYDHLLFICALVIATRSFWEMVKVIAAFTLAHSLTLTLCVFGIFRLPSLVVEPLIALSIVFVALENLLWPANARSKIRLAVAFGFGLVHGLGFGGGLLDAMAGLPAVGIWIALAAFSLGVEIGHQVVVLPLFAALKLSEWKLPESFRLATLRYGSAAISCCGVYYVIVALHTEVFTR